VPGSPRRRPSPGRQRVPDALPLRPRCYERRGTVRPGVGDERATIRFPRGSRSYLTLEEQYSTSLAQAYVPFLVAFGILALIVAVLMVPNVVSGTVVAGLRHIGVMKALGYSPGQVGAVYVLMVLIPGAVATLLGTWSGPSCRSLC
jgi:putative ABC transport system permease protein